MRVQFALFCRCSGLPVATFLRIITGVAGLREDVEDFLPLEALLHLQGDRGVWPKNRWMEHVEDAHA